MTLGRLAVRNEFCQEIMERGGLKLMMETLEDSMDHAVCIITMISLIKIITVYF